MNLSCVVQSKVLGATSFLVERNTFSHACGQSLPVSSEQITASGIIYPGTPDMIEQLPEEHRNEEFIVVFSGTALSLGSKDGVRFTSPDRIHWDSRLWRLVRLRDWSRYGYWQGYAVLLPGEV